MQDPDDLQLFVYEAIKNGVISMDEATEPRTEVRALAADPAPLRKEREHVLDVGNPARTDCRVAGCVLQVVGGCDDVEAGWRRNLKAVQATPPPAGAP